MTGGNPLLSGLASMLGEGSGSTPGAGTSGSAAGAGGTTTTTKAKKKSKPGFLESLLTGLSQGGTSRASIPQAPPIVGAPPPPRGDPNTQRLLEAIILELGGMNQRR